MSFVADTHVHIYPAFDLSLFFEKAFAQLALLGEADHRLLFLTESAQCRFFWELKSGSQHLPPPFRLERTGDDHVLKVLRDEEQIFLVAGRQVVAAERLEILALGCVEAPKDRLPIREVIPAVEQAGGLPVLAWAPGKWMFKRQPVVEALIEEFGDRLWLGDSRLRCRMWPTPKPMHAPARPVLAGSDPLPLSGEEAECGRYGIYSPADVDVEAPWASLKAALGDRSLTRVGHRNRSYEMVQRLWKHSRAKHP